MKLMMQKMIQKHSFYFLAAGMIFLSSCTVTSRYLRKGYEENERMWLKRIALAMEEPVGGKKVEASLEELYLAVASDYLSHHTEYILLRKVRGLSRSRLKEYCQKDSRLNGILLHRFESLQRKSGRVRVGVLATLYDCRSGNRIWEARGKKSYQIGDESLSLLTRSYVNRSGEEARIYAAPYYQMVRKLYRSLPDPNLTAADLDLKIEADAVGPDEGW